MGPVIKRQRQRQRTMRYFIDATLNIASTEGIHRITVRNVAEQAGYNSATIYNYFENLDQLIAISMIDSIKQYLHNLNNIQNQNLDSLETFLSMWRCYAECSFENPEVYSYVFDSENTDFVLSHIESYFSIFPFEENSPNALPQSIVTGQSLKNRNELLISPCIKDGYFKESDKDCIMEFCYILHTGYINRILKGFYETPTLLVESFMRYLIEFLSNHLEPTKKKNLDIEKIMSIMYY